MKIENKERMAEIARNAAVSGIGLTYLGWLGGKIPGEAAAAVECTLGAFGVAAEGKRHLEAVDRILGKKPENFPTEH